MIRFLVRVLTAAGLCSADRFTLCMSRVEGERLMLYLPGEFGYVLSGKA